MNTVWHIIFMGFKIFVISPCQIHKNLPHENFMLYGSVPCMGLSLQLAYKDLLYMKMNNMYLMCTGPLPPHLGPPGGRPHPRDMAFPPLRDGGPFPLRLGPSFSPYEVCQVETCLRSKCT